MVSVFALVVGILSMSNALALMVIPASVGDGQPQAWCRAPADV